QTHRGRPIAQRERVLVPPQSRDILARIVDRAPLAAPQAAEGELAGLALLACDREEGVAREPEREARFRLAPGVVPKDRGGSRVERRRRKQWPAAPVEICHVVIARSADADALDDGPIGRLELRCGQRPARYVVVVEFADEGPPNAREPAARQGSGRDKILFLVLSLSLEGADRPTRL